MLSPEQLQHIPERLVQVMEDLEADILADICRRIRKTGEVTETALHQMRMLAEQGYSQQYIEKRIKQALEIGRDEIDALFEEAVKRNEEYIKTAFDKYDLTAPNRDWKGALNQEVEAIQRQTHAEFRNITQSLGFAFKRGDKPKFYKVGETYQRIMDRVTLEVATGTTDYNTAIRRAVSDLAESGLQYVYYYKEGGYKNGKKSRRDHADVAARRALMTGITQLAGRMSESNMELLNTRYVEVEAHIGARDTGVGYFNHKSWQGRWYYWSRHEEPDPLGKYEDFIKTTGYGEGGGLGGWNCRHSFTSVVPGIDTPRYSEEDLKTIFNPPPVEWNGKKYTAYETTQQQRYYEREMRRCKRHLITTDAAGQQDEYDKWKGKLKGLSAEYKAFSKKVKLPLQPERARVLGFGRAEAAKARRK